MQSFEHGFQGSDNYSWSNDQSVLGSALSTVHIRMRVNTVMSDMRTLIPKMTKYIVKFKLSTHIY